MNPSPSRVGKGINSNTKPDIIGSWGHQRPIQQLTGDRKISPSRQNLCESPMDYRQTPVSKSQPITISKTTAGRCRVNNSISDSLPSSYSSLVSLSSNHVHSLSSSFTSQLDDQSSSLTQSSNDADDDYWISMKTEVGSAVDYLTYLLTKASFEVESTESFRQALTALLLDHYSGHWYPDEPLRGSGYRCLRVNGVMHPILANAADLCSLEIAKFRRAFPVEFTIWIDPGNVNVRIGEDGSIGTFNKPDLDLSGSTSPCLFATPSSTSGSNISTPVGRNGSQTNQRRSSVNRTRLFQQQPLARESPLLKSACRPLGATTPKSFRLGSTFNCDANDVSPVVGYRVEDHGLVTSPLSKRFSVVNDLKSGMVASSDYELCPNVHVGSSSNRRERKIVSSARVMVNA